MPRSLPITPDAVRRAGQIEFTPIPVNQYQRSFAEERVLRGDDALIRIWRDMAIIRAFETLLHDLKLQGAWQGIAYNHRGPAHLSIGQEAAAVGQAFLLDADDHIFGSHRSHGEILAKSLSALERSPCVGDVLAERSPNRGVVSAASPSLESSASFPPALEELLYGTLAEIFGRETGFNRGMGGSMHAFYAPTGVYPNNAIVGGSADIAVGAALFKKVNGRPGLVICNIGDAAASCGPTWEALCFATMQQFHTLWDDAHRGGLPLIVNFVNNFYGMGGQPVGETGGWNILARIGAGLNAAQCHAERIDGYNPLAVIDAIERKKDILAQGGGPVILDTITYRYSGHSPSDASSYRDKSEIEAWRQHDSLTAFGHQLCREGVCQPDHLIALQTDIDTVLRRALIRAIDPLLSPRADLTQPDNLLERTMFSNRRVVSFAPDRTPDVLLPRDENPRVRQIAGKSRSGLNANGELLPKTQCLSLRDALFESILECAYADPTLIVYGEENRDWGGAFGVYRGLTEALPYHRLFNAPIAEAAIVGTAVGYALEGGRALVELMYCDFLGRAGDEVFNQLAKWQAMSGGTLTMPVVVRVSVGSKYGAQHSQDWSSLCAHIPGLKVCFPATPYDAKGLLQTALTGTDPVIFFESQRLYDQPELFHGASGVPLEPYEITIGEPDIKRVGGDLTILTVGATLYRVLDMAHELEHRWGVSAEVIDARSLVPFQYEKVVASVRKTGRLLLTSDACERGSILHTFATHIGRMAFDALDAPPLVVGARNWITPPDELEETFFPFAADLRDAIHTHLIPLPGYTPARPTDNTTLLRRAALGI